MHVKIMYMRMPFPIADQKHSLADPIGICACPCRDTNQNLANYSLSNSLVLEIPASCRESICPNDRLRNSCLLFHSCCVVANPALALSDGGGGGSVILVIRYAVEASAIPYINTPR